MTDTKKRRVRRPTPGQFEAAIEMLETVETPSSLHVEAVHAVIDYLTTQAQKVG